MPLNQTYSREAEVAIKGLIADSRRGYDTITKVASTGISPGFLVTTNGSGQAVKPSSVTDYILGASIWAGTMVQDLSGNISWKADRAMPVFTQGAIWLESGEAIAENALVYATISGVTGNVKSTQGVDTTTKPVGRAETATTATNQLIRVKLLPALQGV